MSGPGREAISSRPAAALGLAVLLALATLGEGGAAVVSMLVWHGVLLSLLLGLLFWPRREDATAWGPEWPPLLAFTLFLALAAYGAARAPYAYAAWLVCLELAAFLGAFVLAATAGPGLLAKAVAPLLAVAALHGVHAIFQRLGGDVRPASSFLNTNHLSAWLVAVVLLAAGAAGSVRSRGRRWLALALALPALVAILLSGSRGALAGALAGAAWLGWKHRRDLNRRARTVLALAALIVLVGVGWRQAGRLLDGDPYQFHRARIWRASLGVLLDDPLWGSGPGQFAVAAARHQFDDGHGPLRYDRVFRATHSDLLRAPCEFGLPAALALLAALCLAALSLGSRVAVSGRGRAEEWPAGADGAIAALIALAVQALFDNPSRWPAAYLLAAVLLGGLLARPRPCAGRLRFGSRAALALVAGLVFVVGDAGPTRGFQLLEKLPRGRLDAAQWKLLERAGRLNPTHPDYWLRRSEHHATRPGGPDLASYAEARNAAEQAARLQPADGRYRFGIAQVEIEACLKLFRDEASRARAYAQLGAARALDPFDVRLALDEGAFARDAGDSPRARRVAEQVLRLEPNAVPALLLLAESLLDVDPHAAARAEELLARAATVAAAERETARNSRYAATLLGLDAARAEALRARIEAAQREASSSSRRSPRALVSSSTLSDNARTSSR